jgi:hypothetical protein
MRNSRFHAVLAGLCLLAAVASANAQATVEPMKLTAEQAFDAVQKQIDPSTGMPAHVVLVDVRSRAEYYWVGTAAQVKTITLVDQTSIVPDLGKVKLVHEGKFLEYAAAGEIRRTQVTKVASVAMAPIAYSVPYQLWDETTRKMAINPEFAAEMQKLAGTVVIFFCRSGGRTDANNCVKLADPALFQAVYEIDQPDGATNHGGFESSNYGNVFNGYRGFPGRLTGDQAHPSVSWKDAGLPIAIGATPLLP